ncbi:GumC family protein [Qipengyuania sediminis]|uniref:GumC family protein n=1 Tax=Qipengyuania sediminis TaxID=1532023 RepID=UPI001059BAEB|nr:Wzz/FepE/Etk N-terminal domain-containing protein [Qipengyuania sediminis]
MNAPAYAEEDEDTGGGIGAILSQLPLILWQRKWLIIVPLVLAIGAAVATAMLLPKKYESSAVLLVQAPALPREIVGQTVDQVVAQRLESIRQQIINRPALIALIERNQLYASERGKTPLSTIIENMRDAITLVPETVAGAGGGSEEKTIAVRLAFVYEDPAKAQAVTQQLMERIVEVDSTNNAEQLTQAVQFLTEQQLDLQRKIALAEGEVAAFNSRYGNVIASGALAPMGGGAAAFDLQISTLEREIADLESQRRVLATSETRDPTLIAAENALAAARAIYSETHPDVVRAKARVEQAQQIAERNVARVPAGEIDTRIRLARNQIAQLQIAKANENSQTAAVMSQRAAAPGIQQQAAQLQQRVQTLYKQFEETSNRLLSARANERAGEEQLGERLMVVDPPVIPDSPESPNRPLIIAIGTAGGLALGLLLALGAELLLRPIRDPSALTALTGRRPLAIIPQIEAQGGARAGSRRRWLPLPAFRKRTRNHEYRSA